MKGAFPTHAYLDSRQDRRPRPSIAGCITGELVEEGPQPTVAFDAVVIRYGDQIEARSIPGRTACLHEPPSYESESLFLPYGSLKIFTKPL
ncbi:MAG: hypothetical protein K6U03_04430, partial [Firmicutes bacterium]|nr:hypothetical protein [Bacillota bacterium]